jgi:hypothetical protein
MPDKSESRGLIKDNNEIAFKTGRGDTPGHSASVGIGPFGVGPSHLYLGSKPNNSSLGAL